MRYIYYRYSRLYSDHECTLQDAVARAWADNETCEAAYDHVEDDHGVVVLDRKQLDAAVEALDERYQRESEERAKQRALEPPPPAPTVCSRCGGTLLADMAGTPTKPAA